MPRPVGKATAEKRLAGDTLWEVLERIIWLREEPAAKAQSIAGPARTPLKVARLTHHHVSYKLSDKRIVPECGWRLATLGGVRKRFSSHSTSRSRRPTPGRVLVHRQLLHGTNCRSSSNQSDRLLTATSEIQKPRCLPKHQ